MKRAVRVPAFAKVNPCLHILARRPDGYHELRTIFQAISLHDTLELALESRGGITLETNEPSLPMDSRNLVWRALEKLRRELGLRVGIRSRLHKRIPVGRGLGGGSSDAASALIGLLRLSGREISRAKLVEIGAGLGADVPFFLFGGRALGVNRGDEIYPLPDVPRRSIVVVSPRNLAVSTREAYHWADRQLTRKAMRRKICDFCALCWSRQEDGVSNDFEAAVFHRYPRLGKIRRALLRAGAAEAALAGSGSAVFGVFRNPAQARRIAQRFPKDRVFVVHTLSRAEYAKALGWRFAV